MKTSNSGFANLLSLLNDCEYHDGTTIGEKLNVTRSAVWKSIQKLESYGVTVDSIKGKGYALIDPLILLDKKAITKSVKNKNIEIDIFESIDSTNEYLKKFLKDKNNRVCLSEQQTQGKGRLNRSWYSPFGLNIYFSTVYIFNKDISELAGLSLVVSLAVVKTLQTYLPKALKVKWPNDILYENQKLSGILIESQAESNGGCSVIIGIGINVNMHFDKENQISQAWTSIRNIVNNYIDRNPLCASLINNLMHYLAQFNEHGLASFKDEWHSVDCLYNKNINIKNAKTKICGKAKGINDQGYLLIKMDDGETRAFSSGDTSIEK